MTGDLVTGALVTGDLVGIFVIGEYVGAAATGVFVTGVLVGAITTGDLLGVTPFALCCPEGVLTVVTDSVGSEVLGIDVGVTVPTVGTLGVGGKDGEREGTGTQLGGRIGENWGGISGDSCGGI